MHKFFATSPPPSFEQKEGITRPAWAACQVGALFDSSDEGGFDSSDEGGADSGI
jgi:hypothetical protein